MKRVIGFLLALFSVLSGRAQHILTIRIKNAKTNELLPGATVLLSNARSVQADSAGLARLADIPAGRQDLKISHVLLPAAAALSGIYLPG